MRPANENAPAVRHHAVPTAENPDHGTVAS